MEKFYLEYYTDPLCCWSWGLEPQMRKLRYLLKDRLQVNYIMGGLLRDWKHFSDQLNTINKPSQMGPLWVEAKHLSGQPIDEHIWINNPVDSSYPACMAVKAAGKQSSMAGEAMLRELRELVMIHKKNIAETEVIIEIAEDLQIKGILNKKDFELSFFSNESSDLFRKDLEKMKLNGVTRFPTMLISFKEKTVQITGYRPFSMLLDTFKVLDPSFHINEKKIDQEDYIASWHYLTNREIEEISPNYKQKYSVTT